MEDPCRFGVPVSRVVDPTILVDVNATTAVNIIATVITATAATTTYTMDDLLDT
jgi:hypothetical protein